MSSPTPNAAAIKSDLDFTADNAIQMIGGVQVWNTYGGLFYNLSLGNDLTMDQQNQLSQWAKVLYSLNTGTTISATDLTTLTNSIISGAKVFNYTSSNS